VWNSLIQESIFLLDGRFGHVFGREGIWLSMLKNFRFLISAITFYVSDNVMFSCVSVNAVCAACSLTFRRLREPRARNLFSCDFFCFYIWNLIFKQLRTPKRKVCYSCLETCDVCKRLSGRWPSGIRIRFVNGVKWKCTICVRLLTLLGPCRGNWISL
jgi:hypothetical protein